MAPFTLIPIEEVLASSPCGREREWAEQLSGALASIQELLRHRLGGTGCPNDPLAEVDRTRPSLDRQARKLGQGQAALLTEAEALQQEVRGAIQVFASHLGSPGTQPPLATATAVPDFGRIRQRAEALLTALRELEKGETDLVQESVTTDIGAGD